MRKLSFALVTLLFFVSALSAASFVNGQAARAMIGQQNFTDAVPGAAQNLLGGVGGLAYANGLLIAADSNRLGAGPQNHRVLIFPTSQIPGPYDEVGSAAHASSTCYLCGWNATAVVGQQDFNSNTPGRSGVPTNLGASANYAGSLNGAVAVATDGQYFAIADTDNNRVLLWNSIPTNSTTPPNVVLGQADANAFQTPQVVNAHAMRGPQGVWIKNGKLFVADTQNNRVLIWNTIPTQNNQDANVVLGQTSFTTAVAPPPSNPSLGYPVTTASKLYTPVAVTSDGTHLFVADLGASRILIWNSIPTTNAQGADVEIGQPDMTTTVPNWAATLCANNTAARCEATIDFPRFALSDGNRLFVADAGNDRVLIYNTIPTTNGAKADVVLGQPDFASDNVTNQAASIASTAVDNTAAVDTTPAPTSLAWDGTSLYVADAFNRRVLLFSQVDVGIPPNSVVNWASEIIRQEGVVDITATTIAANDTVTVTIAGTAYTYTVKAGDTADTIAKGLVTAINATNGDPNVTALKSVNAGEIYLSSKGTNLGFDAISLSASVSNSTNLAATTSGSYLSAGTAATAAPGMLVEINAPFGATFTTQTAAIQEPATSQIATTLAGVEVFMDGVPQPIIKVSPTQIVTLVPWTFTDRNSTSIYVRAVHSDGTVVISNPTAAYIAPANPGLFSSSASGTPPYPAVNATHQYGNPEAVVSIDGTAHAGDTATITINGSRNYTYTVASTDTLAFIVLGLANAINNGNDPDVQAIIGSAFTRVVIVARQPGIAGNGIAVSGSVSANAQVTVTPYTPATCCNVTANAPITINNPAQAGEAIVMSAAGLGTIGATNPTAGTPYAGPVPNNADNSVSATMGGSTAQIVAAGVNTGSYGKYSVNMIVPTSLAANPVTQVYIAQNAFVSNIVTIPVGTPTGIPDPTPTATPTPTSTPTCTYSLSANSRSYLSGANNGAIGVTTQSGCAWSSSVNQSWVTLTKSSSLSGTDYISYSIAANTSGSDRTAILTVANQSVTLTQSAVNSPPALPLQYVPLATPCRAVDTRMGQAPLVSGGSIRVFAISAPCSIPATAQAYAMNATVVPSKQLTFLQLWANGGGQPATSVLNSFDGRIKANSALVQAGNNGSIAAYATDDTQLVLDISGYYVQSGTNASGLSFYPLTPCRVVDTRLSAGALGSPSLAAGQARSFPVLSSGCSIPNSAQAYSLNVTAIPQAPLLYLTAWPAGQSQPATSTLNAPTGTPTPNAAIVQAGTNGGVQVYATANSDLVMDINGYYAPPGSAGALNLYVPAPCRALDTRVEAIFGPISGTFAGANLSVSGCNVPSTAQAFVLNATAIPVNTLSYLTLWAFGTGQPLVSTLNAYDGAVASNLAIVPSGGGAISLFATDPTYVVLDLVGIFAP